MAVRGIAVTRTTSAWLNRRFVDPEATVRFVDALLDLRAKVGGAAHERDRGAHLARDEAQRRTRGPRAGHLFGEARGGRFGAGLPGRRVRRQQLRDYAGDRSEGAREVVAAKDGGKLSAT